MDGLLKFAHSPSHTAGVNWWNKTLKEHRDISIMHEVYEAEAGHWENIYHNYWPAGFGTFSRHPIIATLCPWKACEENIANADSIFSLFSIASAKFPIKKPSAEKTEDGEETQPQQWISSIIDASTGNLNSSMKRMRKV